MKRALLWMAWLAFWAGWVACLVCIPAKRARGAEPPVPQADSVRKLIRSHGRSCETITAARVERGGATIRIGCDGRPIEYTLELLDGRWLFFAPQTTVTVRIPAKCGPAPRGEYIHCEAVKPVTKPQLTAPSNGRKVAPL